MTVDENRKVLSHLALMLPRPSAHPEEAHSAFRRSRPLLGILALAILVAVGLPLVNITIIFPAYTSLLVSTFEAGAKRLAAHTIPPSQKYGKLTRTSVKSPNLLAEIYRLEANYEVLKIKLYSPEGDTLYSTDGIAVQTQTSNPAFFSEVAMGRINSTLSTAARPGPGGKDKPIQIIVTTVPLMQQTEFLGAFEFQFDISSVKARMDRVNNFATYGSIIASLCILFGVIALISKEAGRLAALQQTEQLRIDVDQITRHDLKAPLVGALSGISYLRQYTEIDDEQREVLDEMHNTVITGLEMINRSLDIYKMETGKYMYEPVAVDIEKVCRQVAADLSVMAAEKGVTIRIQIHDEADALQEPLSVAGEETLCYSLLANLVKNAVEASESGHTVTVSLSAKKDVSIAVHNITPVPETIRDTFFEKYTTADKRGGTGLGTYSARLLTRTMGGGITMYSSDEAGTTITVTLPPPTPPDQGA